MQSYCEGLGIELYLQYRVNSKIDLMSAINLVAVDSENPSSTGFLLREFAKVVAVEERDLSNSTDRLIQAADEV